MPVQQTDLQAMPWTRDLMDIDEFRDWVASRQARRLIAHPAVRCMSCTATRAGRKPR